MTGSRQGAGGSEAREFSEERLLHTFRDHAAEWFGRRVSEKTHLENWRRLIRRASMSDQVVEWSLRGGERTEGHLARIEGKWFFVQFYKEGDRAGDLASAFVPNQDQLAAILRKLGH